MAVKTIFIKRILQEEGERLKRNQGSAIAKRLKFHTNRLLNHRVVNVSTDDSMDGKLSLTHPDYLRFLDIKRKVRSKKSNKVHTIRRRIYNRFVYGHYFTIAERLMNDLTPEVIKSIREELKSASNG